MKADRRRILAMGGGGFSTSVADAPLEHYVAGLPAADHPAICLLPTASGDPDEQIDRFHSAFRGLGRLSHLSLFRLGTHPVDPREHLLAQDVIYVGGGSLANLLAIWRVHGLDETLREAWERGIVLCGVSAGSMCWFEHGITRSHGRSRPARGPWAASRQQLRPPRERPGPQGLLRGGGRSTGCAPGYAVDDGVGLLFAGTDLVEVVSAREHARAHRIEERGGRLVETPLVPRLLEPRGRGRPGRPGRDRRVPRRAPGSGEARARRSRPA